ncbi:TetR/AcrR family transcriptional regulator [Streptomyces sp. NPDC126514]|uniref:TetR/AcrR family transcriptional regulator n=1 Tax=Streptomyces sp. NPDC126514 TaxID=3155210 RepID=UPI003319011F
MNTRSARRVGRPRAQERPASGLEPREEVLSAAAELFTTHGYTATTTRAVAERAGLRQASLYHYFDGKEAILAALLEGTVRPSLEVAHHLVSRTEASPEARLWALCHADVTLLCGGPHNLGALYLLPEVQTERFAVFHQVRVELKAAYGQLLAASEPGAALGPEDLALRTDLLFGLTESVILIRRADPGHPPQALAAATADAALRVAGVPQRSLARLRREGQQLLAAGA